MRIAFLALVILTFAANQVAAQTASDEVQPDEDGKSGTTITESDLETFYLRSEESGELIPFFKIPFEEFDDLYQLYKGAANSRPDREYSLENVDVSGKVVDGFAELVVEVEIVSQVDGWVSVPLRLDGLILDKATSDIDPNDFFVTSDSANGYQLWVNSKPDATSSFSLTGFRAIESLSEQSQLKLNLPDSPYSRLAIDIPGKVSEANASANTILEKPVQTENSTKLAVRGPKGGFQLSWRGQEDVRSNLAPSIFSTARIVVRVEGAENIRLQSEIDVEAFGNSLEYVDVRLPPGVELIPIDQQDVTVSLLQTDNQTADGNGRDTTKGESDQGDVVRVTFARATKDPPPFSLVGNLKLNDGEELRMRGFNVVGALRQIGSINIEAERKWSIVQSSSDIDRVPVSDAEFRGQPVYARYKFDRQPFDLRLRVTQTPSRSKIEPVHIARISSNSVRLTTRLACTFEGVAPDVLKVNTSGWRTGSVGPSTLVESATADKDDPTMLNIQLTDYSRQAFRAPQIELTLFKDVIADNGESTVDFELPVPESTSVEPAMLIVSADDNVELRIASDELRGLTPVDLPSEFEVSSGQRPPLAFRKFTPTDETRFETALVVQSRSIEAVSELEVSTQRVRIPGKLPKRIFAKTSTALNFRFEPVTDLFVRVPREPKGESSSTPYSGPGTDASPDDVTIGESPALPEQLNLDMRMDNEPITFKVNDELTDEQYIVLQLDLRTRLLGEHRLDIRYELPAPDVRYPEAIPLDIWLPVLIVPPEDPGAGQGDLEKVACRLTSITTANDQSAGALLVPAPESWAADVELSVEGNGLPQTFLPDQDFDHHVVGFLWEPVGLTSQRARIADKIFLQTNLFRTKRYERFAFRIEGRSEPLRVSLPLYSELISAQINGVEAKSTDGSLIEFDISDRSVEDHVIDIFYQIPQASERSRYVSCIVPTIEDVSSSRELYWELITPDDEYFVGSQAGLTPLLSVNWKDGWFLSRTASMEHRLLEQWVGIPSQPPPDQACNRYVFSSFGPIERHQVLIVSRRELVFFAAFLVLSIGLVVTIFPRVRHPMNLLALIVVLAVSSLRYPDLMLTFLQVAAVTILAGMLIYLIQLAFRYKRESFRRVYWQDDERGETNILSVDDEVYGDSVDFSNDGLPLDSTYSMRGPGPTTMGGGSERSSVFRQ